MNKILKTYIQKVILDIDKIPDKRKRLLLDIVDYNIELLKLIVVEMLLWSILLELLLLMVRHLLVYRLNISMLMFNQMEQIGILLLIIFRFI